MYRLTDAGRLELAGVADELTELEHELVGSIRDLAAEVRHDVRGSVRSLREELKVAAKQARREERSAARPAPKELRELEQEIERFRTEVRLLARRSGVTPEAVRAARSRISSVLEELRADLGSVR